MNEHRDQNELGEVIAQNTGIDQNIANVFIKELFAGIEEELIGNSSIKIEGLGLFRIIQSGTKNRILFLGDTSKSVNKGLLLDKYQPISELPVSSNTNNLQVDNNLSERIKSRLDDSRSRLEQKVEAGIEEVLTNSSSSLLEILPLPQASKEPITKNEVEKPQIEDLVKPSLEEQKVENTSSNDHQTTNSNDVIANRDVEVNRNVYSAATVNKTTSRGKSKIPVYVVFGILFLLILGTFVYKFVLLSSPTQEQTYLVDNQKQVDLNEDNITKIFRFAEVPNSDPHLISCVILVDTNIHIQDLSNIYYGKKIFWPYIFKANINVIDHDLIVKKNTIIKIPKITVNLVDYSTGVLDKRLVVISNRLKQEIREKQN